MQFWQGLDKAHTQFQTEDQQSQTGIWIETQTHLLHGRDSHSILEFEAL